MCYLIYSSEHSVKQSRKDTCPGHCSTRRDKYLWSCNEIEKITFISTFRESVDWVGRKTRMSCLGCEWDPKESNVHLKDCLFNGLQGFCFATWSSAFPLNRSWKFFKECPFEGTPTIISLPRAHTIPHPALKLGSSNSRSSLGHWASGGVDTLLRRAQLLEGGRGPEPDSGLSDSKALAPQRWCHWLSIKGEENACQKWQPEW